MTNITQIGEFRITRKHRHETRRTDCQHRQFTIDEHGDVVTCDDCQKQISAMWALALLVEHYNREMSRLQRQRNDAAETAKTVLHLKAAQRVQEAWRSRTMVPLCPHCRDPIFAEDGFGGSSTNKAMAIRRREVSREAKLKIPSASQTNLVSIPPG